jgi:general stress protein CsbA
MAAKHVPPLYLRVAAAVRLNHAAARPVLLVVAVAKLAFQQFQTLVLQQFHLPASMLNGAPVVQAEEVLAIKAYVILRAIVVAQAVLAAQPVIALMPAHRPVIMSVQTVQSIAKTVANLASARSV